MVFFVKYRLLSKPINRKTTEGTMYSSKEILKWNDFGMVGFKLLGNGNPISHQSLNLSIDQLSLTCELHCHRACGICIG